MLSLRASSAAAVAALAVTAAAGSLTDIKHIVLFMQENRAFDHYFGTMAGVRGFADPNVHVNPDGHSIFEQLVSSSLTNASDVLKPWYLNYLGGSWVNATQCMTAGSNSWQAMHGVYNDGLVNHWAEDDTPYSWGHFTRDEVPTHFDIAEGWTESILAATDPNRIHWLSNSVNTPGTPSNPDGAGGMILDNTATPGCEAAHFNCYPFTWKTFPEYLEAAGVSWQVFQDVDNFEDNPLAYFVQYQNATNGSALRTKGDSYEHTLDVFYARARNGTLPQVSWIIGPAELSEHPPYLPSDGAWLQKQVVDAVTQGAAYESTALFITYDEIGGWGDHVLPIVPPNGTAGEWIDDPYGTYGWVPVGPGYRVPSYIISPWTRGGNVFVEHADHSSETMFVEQWAAANGYEGVYSEELTPWRRAHMSNLVAAFDFEHPDYSLPSITAAPTPLMDTDAADDDYSGDVATLGSLTGPYVGLAACLSAHAVVQPPVPYGSANVAQNLSRLVEDGFKRVRGGLTEGRYLTLEMDGHALANVDGQRIQAAVASADHRDVRQRWILHVQEDEQTLDRPPNRFTLQSALDGTYISSCLGRLTANATAAQPLVFSYHAATAGFSLALGTDANKTHAKLTSSGSVRWDGEATDHFAIYSVTYKD
ncbi:non-hemolytic phospholipase c [Grosmannia clavigera kw1407]|uniref:Non-hemolytic phospholipase c n=1 Tax=Grosmannia clavigera (strain kw1407 / UAMH 11150) TaxID=655863 RepID=F0XLH7_GROCL|nr:non-hemolytic phospholipase c [Grosmannia clavigera kw1407]EFX01061.1 non-hemolytic phospholipase c [Grosmannia clavigera kw1407]